MQILYCDWNSQCDYILKQTFEKLGHSLLALSHSFENETLAVDSLRLLQDALDHNHFDFVFSHNFLSIVAKVCRVYRIPYICWVMDSPCYTLYSEAITSPYNRIFIFDRALYESVAQSNPSGIYYFPLATCMDYWDSITATEADHQLYQCDVSFIGSLYIQSSPYNDVTGLSEYTRGYLDGLIDAQLRIYGYNFLRECLTPDIIQEFKSCADWKWNEDYRIDDATVITNHYLNKRCAELERCQIAERLASAFDFHLYTNSDVSRLNGVPNLGTIDYYDTFPRVVQCSKINLNITSKSIQTGLSLRIFDILGAGGFLLTNYQEELPEYFEIGTDLDIYESMDDLQNKITYYLERPELRQEIAKNGQEKVRQNYTYEIALKKMLSLAFTNDGGTDHERHIL